ncbi:unnamed protein product [Symbiodinium sp. CCMP2592]|nr:unnamed protein product [Symbiodinium sp. CCMP2592]
MSAQDARTVAPQVNGVDRAEREGPRDEGANGTEAAVNEEPEGQLAGVSEVLTAPRYGAVDRDRRDVPTTSASPPLREDTESRMRQGATNGLPTTVEADRALRGGNVGLGGDASTSQAGFVTPRSTSPGLAAQNNWLGSLEVPRWMSRLGNYLSIAHEQLAPSPLVATEAAKTSAGFDSTEL